jgi:hypothetical protein
VWDHTAKKRLRQYPKYHNAVNDVSFNKTGTKLAVGVSYGWEKGEHASKLAENARVSVFVRDIGDEVKVCSLRCRPMRDIESIALFVNSSSQRRRREPDSFGRASKLSSYNIANSAPMYPISTIGTYFLALSKCCSKEPPKLRSIWKLGLFKRYLQHKFRVVLSRVLFGSSAIFFRSGL